MELPSRLEDNIENLSAELVRLKHIKEELVKNGGGQIDLWLQSVEHREHSMNEIEKEYNELKSGLLSYNLNRKFKLNKKVIKSLKAVKALIMGAIIDADSVETFLTDATGDNLKSFSCQDLTVFTSEFSTEIGAGGFGKVYKGEFANGVQIAVKVLIQKSVSDAIFMMELSTMVKASRPGHPNLIKLYGYCSDGNMRALVYEYVENGSLDKVLFENHIRLEWQTLYGIAIDIAKALAYLHHDCSEQIIHHDAKPANVLLDANLSPKVTDFGMARIMDRDVSHFTMTSIRGTCGYVAPEMIMYSSRVTYKCDVFSFGMILFDFLGMKNNTESRGMFPLLVWEKFNTRQLEGLIAECGIGEKDTDRAMTLARVALWCIQFTPEKRPSMKKVVNALEMEIKFGNPPNPFLACNEEFSMQQSQNMIYSIASTSDERQLRNNPLKRRMNSTTSNLELSASVQKELKENFKEESTEILPRSALIRFLHGDLKIITKSFSTRLSSDESGDVYKGEFSNGVQVVVKVLAEMDITEDMFIAEVSTMAMAYHPNLVKLYGYCFDGHMSAVVHEYMGNISLHKILYESHLSIPWDILYQIALEIANVLSYLHDGCNKRIIHQDLKVGNVLLNSNLSPKVKNFELAKFMNKDSSHVTLTTFGGTPGYTAPEIWIQPSNVTCKCDVYSFGMILFEILGMRSNNQKQSWFPRQVWDKLKTGQLDGLLEKYGIQDKYREKAKIMSTVALWCIQLTPEIRPSMRSVVSILENEIQVTTPPNPFRPSNLELSEKKPCEPIYAIFSPSSGQRLLENTVSNLKCSVSIQNEHKKPFRKKTWEAIYAIFSPSSGQRILENTISNLKCSVSIQIGHKKPSRKEPIEKLLSELPSEEPKQYSREDIMEITGNFSESDQRSYHKLGMVYNGKLSNGVQVSVTLLSSHPTKYMFMACVREEADISHPYLVRFYGYCYEMSIIALVHDYASGISLDEILFKKRLNVAWEKLYDIAIGTAKAISYLHNDCHKQMIHHQIIADNVVVDSNLSPRVINFGRANRVGLPCDTFGTVHEPSGHDAPEKFTSYLPIASKCDVYSFGLILFEILGRERIYNEFEKSPKHVWESFEKGKLNQVIEDYGIENKDKHKAKVLCMVALWCIQYTPDARPSMNTVVNILENEIQVTTPPSPFLPSQTSSISMKPSQELV